MTLLDKVILDGYRKVVLTSEVKDMQKKLLNSPAKKLGPIINK